MRLRLAVIVAVLLAVTGSARSARGQDAGARARPYRPVFGGASDAATDRDLLTVSASVEETYDDNLLVDTVGVAPVYQISGWYTGLNDSIDFTSRGDRLQTKLTAGSNVRYYSSLGRAALVSYLAGAGIGARIGPGLNLVVDQSVVYSPSYLYGLFASVIPPGVGNFVTPAANYAASPSQSYTYVTTVRLTQNIGKRGQLSFDSGLHRTNFTNILPGFSDFNSYDAGGRFTYRLTRFGSLRLGYVHRNTEYSPSIRPVEHDIDAGIDYQRPLSRSRRTTFAFSAGTASFTGPLLGAVPNDIRRQFGVTADASLARQIGRTWQLRGTYHRGLSNIEGFQSPVLTDAITVAGTGFLNRRTDLSMSAAYTGGDSPFTPTRSTLTTYTADLRLRYAISRRWAPYVEYLYYFYNFDKTMPLPPGVTPQLQRNSIRVGLATWVPLWKRR